MPDDVARLLRTRLDPVLTRHGFASAQVGRSPRDVAAIFCAAEDEFRARFPRLVRLRGPEHDGGCADVVVRVTEGGPLTAGLDGTDLPELLVAAGRPDLADDARSLADLLLADALDRLAGLLDAAFAAAGPGS